VLLIRRIRELLYEEGFTISGARNRLDGASVAGTAAVSVSAATLEPAPPAAPLLESESLRQELQHIVDILRA
jgi:hypothetical protein